HRAPALALRGRLDEEREGLIKKEVIVHSPIAHTADQPVLEPLLLHVEDQRAVPIRFDPRLEWLTLPKRVVMHDQSITLRPDIDFDAIAPGCGVELGERVAPMGDELHGARPPETRLRSSTLQATPRL